jgi:hypothetical protein
MAAETVDTYTFIPSTRSVFAPENIDEKVVNVVPTPAKNTAEPMKIQQINTKKK